MFCNKASLMCCICSISLFILFYLIFFFSIYSLCTKDSFPLTFQACVMPKNCQTSDWSSWSPCSKTCRSVDLSPGYRLRSRIMTQISVGGGKRCPALEEKEACNIIGDLLPNCPRQFLTAIVISHLSPQLAGRKSGNILSSDADVCA